MDLNYDEQCKDAFYCLQKVSQNPPGSTSQSGYNGLYNPDTGGNSDNFLYHGKVMVWSAGPDGKIDPAKAGEPGSQPGQHSELAVKMKICMSSVECRPVLRSNTAEGGVSRAKNRLPETSGFRLSALDPRPLCAFTLIEMLVVIAILGILAALTVPVLKNFGRSDATTSTVVKLAIHTTNDRILT